MTTTYTITPNEAFKSLEINFDGKPTEAVREALKALRFRWHGIKKIWYGYSDEEAVRKAIENAENGVKVSKVEKAVEKKNKYGVKVGDIFEMSWGYDQTNVDFFQVLAICGEQSVRVREVSPEIVSREATCPMAEDRVYNITSDILEARSYSIFVKDQEKGDIKRVKDYGNGVPCINVGDHLATRVSVGEHKAYVSWYH